MQLNLTIGTHSSSVRHSSAIIWRNPFFTRHHLRHGISFLSASSESFLWWTLSWVHHIITPSVTIVCYRPARLRFLTLSLKHLIRKSLPLQKTYFPGLIVTD